jgi:hypothetical protein
MSFVVAGNSNAEAGEAIENNGFWPGVDPADFRATTRVDTTITEERVAGALRAAMIDTNDRLRDWQADQVAAGHASAGDVPAPSHRPAGSITALYLRAVYALAKANLVERYRDYDSAGSESERVEDLTPTIDDYRRDAAWAISDLIGRNRSTVELI